MRGSLLLHERCFLLGSDSLLSCEHFEMCMRSLDLAGHASLKHLSLRNVYPLSGLLLPQRCRLDLHGEACTFQQVRQTALNTFVIAL
jgi:hypothetical protein